MEQKLKEKHCLTTYNFSHKTPRNRSKTLVFLLTNPNFEGHIRNVTKVSFYHFRNRVRSFLSQAYTEKLVHAFISSRLDYCNSLLSGVSKKATGQLQLVQNAAARVLTKKTDREPTSLQY